MKTVRGYGSVHGRYADSVTERLLRHGVAYAWERVMPPGNEMPAGLPQRAIEVMIACRVEYLSTLRVAGGSYWVLQDDATKVVASANTYKQLVAHIQSTICKSVTGTRSAGLEFNWEEER